ncbi:MAG: C40 family peptidase [Chloroflexota bacterium]
MAKPRATRQQKHTGNSLRWSTVFGIALSASLVFTSCAAPAPTDTPLPTSEAAPTIVAEATAQPLAVKEQRETLDLVLVPELTTAAAPDATPAEVALAVPAQRTAIVVHKVAEGETLGAIAEQYSITPQTVAGANGLQSEDNLAVGQELRILPVSGTLHKVQEGDTLEAVAAIYGVEVMSIIVANGIDDPNSLVSEQELVVPGGSMPSRSTLASRSGQRPVAMKPGYYVVQPGDSLLSIAESYDISVETLLWANDISDPNTIQPGTELLVLPVSGVLYVVKPGDTINGIAEGQGVGADEILMANGIDDPATIHVGDKLLLPGAKPVSEPQPTPVKPTATPALESKPQVAAAVVASTPTPKAEPAATPKPVATATPKPVATATPKPPAPTATPKPAAPAPAPATGGNVGQRVVAIAQEYIGHPYVWGGVGPNSFDCTGFVWYIFNKRLGIPMPRDLWGQLGSGARVPRAQVQAGDLVFFQNTYQAGLSHVGIAIDNKYFVHAASERYGVMVSNLNDGYWAPRFYAASRPY